ncbi:MAG: fimbrillin family protein, partial [Alistipes sp.]|nr:fimbrillin family protein [Alistipes sp.]
MKKIFFALIAVVAMVSCSKDEVIDYNKQAIAFGDVFVDNATRADYSNGQDLEQFNVYGIVKGTMNGTGTVNIIAGIPETGSVGSDVWSYDAQYAQYWIPGADYNFAAVVDATVTAPDSSYGMPTALTTVADNTMNLKDMFYAEASVVGTDVTDTYNEPVNFTFNHLLSKVHFTVTSNAQGGYYHTVTDISVSNFQSGTFTLDNAITPAVIDAGTWAGNTAKDIAFADIAEVTNTGAKSNADMLLVPNAATFNVKFTVNLYKDDTEGDILLGTQTKTVPVTIEDAQDEVVGLQKGHAYNFTIACS